MKKTVIAIVVSCCVSLTGCGDDAPAKSDDKASETTASLLTTEELITQGDAICTESNTRIDAADDRFVDPASPTEAEFRVAVNDVVIPEIKAQVAALRELRAPAEDAATIDSMLDAVEAGVTALETDPLALLQGDVFGEANAIAQGYGFEACGA